MGTVIENKKEQLNELVSALISGGYIVKLTAENPKTGEVLEWPICRPKAKE